MMRHSLFTASAYIRRVGYAWENWKTYFARGPEAVSLWFKFIKCFFLLSTFRSKERLGEEARAVRERTQSVLEELNALQRHADSHRNPQQVCAQK